jgi:tRNA (guanine37-N1)-methyltransferase
LVKIRDALSRLIPPQKANLIYSSYDIIGDIIITKVPHELDDYEREVGQALLEAHPKATKVFRIVGETQEIERYRQLKLLWSKPQPARGQSPSSSMNIGRTLYKEHGCRFLVDVEKVFFTPRLSYERMRIAKQVRPGEVVATMFGGVGTYSIVIAKVCPSVAMVHTIDVNPFAYDLARENVIINKCSRTVIPILGDARMVCHNQLKNLCSRIIMPLPGDASMFLSSAVAAMKKKEACTLNFYAEVSGTDVENETHEMIYQTRKTIMACGAEQCEADNWRIVREVGPRRYHIAIDFTAIK